MTQAKVKRGNLKLDRLTSSELEYLISGHDYFNDINMKLIKGKWNLYRDEIMKHWLTY